MLNRIGWRARVKRNACFHASTANCLKRAMRMRAGFDMRR